MTLIIALTDRVSEIWVASDTRGAIRSDSGIKPLPGVFRKTRIVKEGQHFAVVSIGGLSMLGERSVYQHVVAAKKELLADDNLTELCDKLRAAWAHDYATTAWASAEQKQKAHETERLNVLIVRQWDWIDRIEREYRQGTEVFQAVPSASTLQSLPCAYVLLPTGNSDISRPFTRVSIPVAEWAGLLADAFVRAQSDVSVGFPVDVFRVRQNGVTFVRYNTPEDLRRRRTPESPFLVGPLKAALKQRR